MNGNYDFLKENIIKDISMVLCENWIPYNRGLQLRKAYVMQ